ncbi:MAG: hypothetical protein WB780_20400 [Candidatus Acidiferrales bacterium]
MAKVVSKKSKRNAHMLRFATTTGNGVRRTGIYLPALTARMVRTFARRERRSFNGSLVFLIGLGLQVDDERRELVRAETMLNRINHEKAGA